MRVPNASTILIIPAVSANLAATGGSSDPFNLAGYYGAMVIGTTGSNGNGGTGVSIKAVRSATSNGTFNNWGFSLSPIAGGSGKTSVRNFLVNTSATWHKIVYNNNGGGSYNPVVFVLGFRSYTEPVPTQNTNVTAQGDLLSG
jgi:hypothetical protein